MQYLLHLFISYRRTGGFTDNYAIPVKGVCIHTKSDCSLIFLHISLQKLHQLRSLVDPHYQNTGGKRVEGPCMTDLSCLCDSSYNTHNVMRCGAFRFINDQDGIQMTS